MDFPDLPHVRQLQKDLWQWPKARAAVMVGAGFSRNADPLPGVKTHFPTWRELVRAMFDELYPPQPDGSFDEVRLNTSTPLRIASEYEAAFGRRKLELLIQRMNPDADHQPGKLHHLLLQLPWVDVFTTNYDTLLEKTDVDGRAYQPVTKAAELTKAFAPRIVKLHGSFPSQSPFIISEEDYRTYPRLFAPFINSVQQSLLENAFVLIGFSGDDPNFLEWTGWIRDELGGHHAPIYLVGRLSLSSPARLLLANRGVTPIDLSPLSIAAHSADQIHARSLEWFLNVLWAARPPRPETWPGLTPTAVPVIHGGPPIIEMGPGVPPRVGFPQQVPPAVEVVEGVLRRWQFERAKYPGWLIAPAAKRSEVWDATKLWIDPLIAFSMEWPARDRILLFREINWRLEISMTPLFSQWVEPFQRAVDELFDRLAAGQSIPPSVAFPLDKDVTNSDIADAWLEIAFALLRSTRETYDGDGWNTAKAKLDRVIHFHAKHVDRSFYEAALWAVWNVERPSARVLLSQWQPSLRSPQAAMWKAGLLAELDEPGLARTILRTALREIRRGLRTEGRNIELLSLEGWCTYMLFSIESALDIGGWNTIRDEFWERWQELKAWDCDPWPYMEYLEDVLAAPPPRPHEREREVRDFDGRVTSSLSLIDDPISRYLPGFACIRLYEQVGLPLRLPLVNVLGTTLKNACRWVAPFNSFWSAALLIRAGKRDDIIGGGFLTRTQVAAMESGLAGGLYAWCLRILDRELAGLTGPLAMGSANTSLLAVLSEVLSRLAFKVDATTLRTTFPLILRFHNHPEVRAHLTLHEACDSWFERLFDAADDDLLLEWLPDLVRAPIFDGGTLPLSPRHASPDPMRHFPEQRARKVMMARSDLVEKVKDATDWLLKRVLSEIGESRNRTIDRLIKIHFAKLLTADQERQLAEVLWSGRDAQHPPDHPPLITFGFANSPTAPAIDVTSVIKHYVTGMTSDGVVRRDSNNRVSVVGCWNEMPMIHAAALVSRPTILLPEERAGIVEWTDREAADLYRKAHDWWLNDKEALSLFGAMGAGPVRNTLRRLGQFLSRVVLPRMKLAKEAEWEQLLEWLLELREAGGFPTLALPYVLMHRAGEAAKVAEIIATDLNSEAEDAITAAGPALRHWTLLSVAGFVPAPPPALMTTLIERVCFRRMPGIVSCLRQLAFLLARGESAISTSQAALIAASLVPWHHATTPPSQEVAIGDFQEGENADLRVSVAWLAEALRIWYSKVAPGTSEPPQVTLWRHSCAADPLPEIRRAFSDFEQFGLS